MQSVVFTDLGLIPYADAEALQAEAALAVAQGGPAVVFLLEHPPTITFGRNGGEEHLPMAPEAFSNEGVTLARASRGGSITCHFPGQLVIYPIVRVDKRPGGLKQFFHDMEEVILRVLGAYGLAAGRYPGRPGVWLENRKIASMGIAVKRWVTSHGLALNVGRDLALFERITPCGLPGVQATSLCRELGLDAMDMAGLKSAVRREFLSVFSMREHNADTGPARQTETAEPPLRLPPWLRRPLPVGRGFQETRSLVEGLSLPTVCKGARCPNIHHCYESGTVTFLILGDTCTRNCAFCNIDPGRPGPPDPTEPERVAEAARSLNLAHVVITSVTRDDLPDGGAEHFAATVRAVRSALPQSTVEVLTPDFQGSEAALHTVAAGAPTVINHNVETCPGLYPVVRPQADYRRSLELLARVNGLGLIAKSGFMVGLGETDEDVALLLKDLARAGCSMVTIGQYMRPSRRHPPVARYVTPETFEEYARKGLAAGIPHVFSAPLVRSSYHARETLLALAGGGL